MDDDYYFNFTNNPYVEPPLNDYDEVEDGKRVYYLQDSEEKFVERYGAQATLDTTTGEIQNITSESLEGKFTSIQIGIKTLGGTKYKPTPRGLWSTVFITVSKLIN